MQGNTDTNKYYLTMLMNIYIKIRFGSCICIPRVLGNL